MKLKIGLLILAVNVAIFTWLLGGGGRTKNKRSGLWNVFIISGKTATITFNNGIAAGQSVVGVGSSSFSVSPGNLLIAAGNTVGGPCQLNPGASVIIAPGMTAIGTISFLNACTNALLTNLEIAL